jgi:hypothetical protein
MVYTSDSIIAGAHDNVVVAGNTVKFWLSAARVVAKELERLLDNEHWGIRLQLLTADGQPCDFASFIFEYKNGYTTWSVKVSLEKGKPALVVIPDRIITVDVGIWKDIGKFLENFEYIKDYIDYTVGA